MLQIEDIDILHIAPLVLHHIQFHNDQEKIQVIGFFIVIENSIPFELHHSQDTFNFITNEKALDLVTILVSAKNAIVVFVDPKLEINSKLEFIILHIGLHQDHFPDLCLYLEELSILNSSENHNHYNKKFKKIKRQI